MSKKKRTSDQFILARRDQNPPDLTTGPFSQPDDDTSEKVIMNLQQRPDPEPIKEDQTGTDSWKITCSLAGPNPVAHG
ncbi:hypothetical protein Tco_1300362 [Tanacetum coccineum]